MFTAYTGDRKTMDVMRKMEFYQKKKIGGWLGHVLCRGLNEQAWCCVF